MKSGIEWKLNHEIVQHNQYDFLKMIATSCNITHTHWIHCNVTWIHQCASMSELSQQSVGYWSGFPWDKCIAAKLTLKQAVHFAVEIECRLQFIGIVPSPNFRHNVFHRVIFPVSLAKIRYKKLARFEINIHHSTKVIADFQHAALLQNGMHLNMPSMSAALSGHE